MRERIKEILGPKYNHAIFHEMLLEEGPLPLAVLERMLVEKTKKNDFTIRIKQELMLLKSVENSLITNHYSTGSSSK